MAEETFANVRQKTTKTESEILADSVNSIIPGQTWVAEDTRRIFKKRMDGTIIKPIADIDPTVLSSISSKGTFGTINVAFGDGSWRPSGVVETAGTGGSWWGQENSTAKIHWTSPRLEISGELRLLNPATQSDSATTLSQLQTAVSSVGAKGGVNEINVPDGLGGWKRSGLKLESFPVDQYGNSSYLISAGGGSGMLDNDIPWIQAVRSGNGAKSICLRTGSNQSMIGFIEGSGESLFLKTTNLSFNIDPTNGAVLSHKLTHPNATLPTQSATLGQVETLSNQKVDAISGFDAKSALNAFPPFIVSWNSSTRTLSVQNQVPYFSYGNRFSTLTTKSVVIPNSSRANYVGYGQDGELVVYGQSTINADIEERWCPVCSVYFDATLGDEITTIGSWHSSSVGGQERATEQRVEGIKYARDGGLAISAIHGQKTISMTSGTLVDVESRIEIPAESAFFPVYWYDGKDSENYNRIKRKSIIQTDNKPFCTDIQAGIGSTGRLIYNVNTAGTFSIATVSANNYTCCHIYGARGVFPNGSPKFITAVIGQAQYGSLNLARDSILSEVASLHGNPMVIRAKLLYSLILDSSGNIQYVNATNTTTVVDHRLTNMIAVSNSGTIPTFDQVLQAGNVTSQPITTSGGITSSGYISAPSGSLPEHVVNVSQLNGKVSTTGNETIAGIKSFSDPVVSLSDTYVAENFLARVGGSSVFQTVASGSAGTYNVNVKRFGTNTAGRYTFEVPVCTTSLNSEKEVYGTGAYVDINYLRTAGLPITDFSAGTVVTGDTIPRALGKLQGSINISGTFTATASYTTGTVTFTVSYKKINNIVYLKIPKYTGTSIGSTSCGFSGIPAELRPLSDSQTVMSGFAYLSVFNGTSGIVPIIIDINESGRCGFYDLAYNYKSWTGVYTVSSGQNYLSLSYSI